MDLEIVILSEARQRELYDIPYMQNLKERIANELIYKRKTDLEIELMVTSGGEIDWEFGWTYILIYLKQITKKDLLYITDNSAQLFIVA